MNTFRKSPPFKKTLLSVALVSFSIVSSSVFSSVAKPNIEVIQLPQQDNEALFAKYHQAEKTNEHERLPFTFAEPVETDLEPYDSWSILESGTLNEAGVAETFAVWERQITSSGAKNINLGFKEFFLPEEARLTLSTPDNRETLVLTHLDNDDHGQYWTPIFSGDTVIIKLEVPEAQRSQVQLNLSQVSHGFVGHDINSIAKEADAILESGSCNVDVVCSEGDDWRDQINSVARIVIGGSSLCSGAAINNTANDGRRLFLTANHCTETPDVAPSIVAYWKYENSTCRAPGSSASGNNGNGQLSSQMANSGSVMRAQYDPSDMYLIEFDDPFPEAANVYLAGWNRSANAPSGAVGIHHPRGHEKRISFENNQLTMQSTHIRVNDWDLGTTEGGSSGSPLFDLDKLIIGQLTGGSAACGNDEYDIYGHMSVNWTGGGNARSRVSDWLDPNNTGAMTVQGRYASGDAPQPTPTPTATTPPPTNPPTPAPTAPPIAGGVAVEAESGSLTGVAAVYNDAAASGGQGVAFISEIGAGFTIDTPNQGTTVSFTVRYASMSSGSVSYFVNGSDAGDISFNSTGAWVGNYTNVTVTQTIPAGGSFEIRFQNGDAAMNVDNVTFHLDDNQPTPTVAPPTPTPTLTPTPTATVTPMPTVTPIPTVNPTPAPTPTATPIPTTSPGGGDCGDFGIAYVNDSTLAVYHQDEGWSGSWNYICLNGACYPGTLSEGYYSREFSGSLGQSYNIEFKVQDNATGQYITSGQETFGSDSCRL